jgi:predicted acyltransferase (DUF342 family)
MREMKMYRDLVVAGIILFAGSIVCADVITTPNQFNVLAGGSFSTGTGVTIQGLTGAVGDVYLGSQTIVGSSVYTNGTFGTDHHAGVTGQVISTGNVSIGHHSQIGSVDTYGNIYLDQNVSVEGSMLAGQNVSISKSSTIDGNVNYGGTYWKDNKATINGTTGTNLSGLEKWTSSLRTNDQSWVTGSQSVYVNNGLTQTLSAGSYGSFSTGSNAVIYLTAGTYDFGSIYLGSGVKFIADTSAGSVVIRVANGFSTGSNVSIDGGDTGGLSVYTNGSIYLGTNSTAQANLLSLGNSVSIDSGCQITGNLYSAGTMWIGNNSSIAMGPSSVPEPSSFLLCAGGLLLMSHRSRRFNRVEK